MNEHKKYQQVYFHWFDYITFLFMIALSTGLGVYYGHIRKLERIKAKSKSIHMKHFGGSAKLHEYMLGSRKLNAFPVAMSLIASSVSGVTILGTVTEIYNFGTQYSLILIPIFFHAIAVIKIFLPVFAALRVDSSYEYLERRFGSVARSVASVMFLLDEVLFLPVILYIPALSLHQVTGINIHVTTSTLCLICVSYTLFGGISAAVHTSVLQILVMFLSVALVLVLGIMYAGGFGEVIQTASDGDRLIFANTNTSLYDRETLWGVLIGGFFYWTSYNSVNQTMVQRYMSLPSRRKAKRAVALFTLGISTFIFMVCCAGLLVYHCYKDCDPLTAGIIKHNDQLLPLYVMETIGHLYGVPGIFIAGIFGAALSSLSVVLNSTALVILEDVTKGLLRLHLSEKASTILVKTWSAVIGVVAVCLVFVLERLGGILGVTITITAIATGTTFGLFSLGMLVPWANNKGALSGVLAGALITGWLAFGSQLSYVKGLLVEHRLPVSVKDCPNAEQLQVVANNTRSPMDAKDVFSLYRLSFHWINPIGVLTTVLVGTIISFMTGPTIIKTLDAKVISPVIHRYLPKQCFAARITHRSRRRTRRRFR